VPAAESTFVRRAVIAAAVGIAAVLLVALVWRARLAVLVIYLSLLAAVGLLRPVRAIGRLSARIGLPLPLWAAALLVYLVVIGIATTIVLVAAAPLVSQAEALWQGIPHQFDRFQVVLRHYGLVARHVTLQEAVQNVPRTDALASMNTVLTAGSTFAAVVVGVVSVLILSYYFLVEGEETANYLLCFVPAARQPGVRHAIRVGVRRISRWVEATIILGGVMGVATAVALGVIGVPYFYVVALVAALGETVPMVGPLVAGAVAVTVALTISPQLALGVGALFVVLHELEANVLVPKIMEQRIGISAIAVMCGLLVGWEVLGVLGAVLAIPTVVIGTVVAEQCLPHQTRRARAADASAVDGALAIDEPHS
jgi:predicted PurR-regulated permease PerM